MTPFSHTIFLLDENFCQVWISGIIMPDERSMEALGWMSCLVNESGVVFVCRLIIGQRKGRCLWLHRHSDSFQTLIQKLQTRTESFRQARTKLCLNRKEHHEFTEWYCANVFVDKRINWNVLQNCIRPSGISMHLSRFVLMAVLVAVLTYLELIWSAFVFRALRPFYRCRNYCPGWVLSAGDAWGATDQLGDEQTYGQMSQSDLRSCFLRIHCTTLRVHVHRNICTLTNRKLETEQTYFLIWQSDWNFMPEQQHKANFCNASAQVL